MTGEWQMFMCKKGRALKTDLKSMKVELRDLERPARISNKIICFTEKCSSFSIKLNNEKNKVDHLQTHTQTSPLPVSSEGQDKASFETDYSHDKIYNIFPPKNSYFYHSAHSAFLQLVISSCWDSLVWIVGGVSLNIIEIFNLIMFPSTANLSMKLNSREICEVLCKNRKNWGTLELWAQSESRGFHFKNLK